MKNFKLNHSIGWLFIVLVFGICQAHASYIFKFTPYGYNKGKVRYKVYNGDSNPAYKGDYNQNFPKDQERGYISMMDAQPFQIEVCVEDLAVLRGKAITAKQVKGPFIGTVASASIDEEGIIQVTIKDGSKKNISDHAAYVAISAVDEQEIKDTLEGKEQIRDVDVTAEDRELFSKTHRRVYGVIQYYSNMMLVNGIYNVTFEKVEKQGGGCSAM